jgi:hypothetical protein
MDNARYATHDDTPLWTKDWIILCCMKNVTVTVIWKMNCHLPSTMFTHVFYMAFFISHVISTRDAHISQRTEGPRANMGRGLRWETCNCMRIMSLNTYNKNVDIIWHYCIISQIKLYGFWKRSALTNMKKDALKYMINRLWYGIFHISCHINPRPILALG